MLRIFIGYDSRQALSFNVLQHSIIARSSVPVSIIPLVLETLPLKRSGLTPFSWSRFLVPYLCDYEEGPALFMDADMLCLCDIKELLDLYDPAYAVMVSKNKHKFEWASLMLFNTGHPYNDDLTPEVVETSRALHGLQWLGEDHVGELPGKYNFLAGYDDPISDAKIVHYTQGLPIYPETEGTPYAAEWKAEHKAMNSIKPWRELMGGSVHAAQTADGRMVAKLHKDAVK